MNETEKKCLIASASMHGLLLLILVVGSAFFTQSRKPASRDNHITMIPDIVIDKALSGGGGNPDAGATLVKKEEKPPPAPPPLPPPPKPPEIKRVDPPKVEKTPVKEVTKPRDNKTNPLLANQPKKPVKETPIKDKPEKPDLGKIVPIDKAEQARKKAQAEADAKERAKAQAKAEAEAQAKAREYAKVMEQRSRQFDQTLGNLETGLSKGTVVGIRGPGGQSYAGYDEYVRLVFDNAWLVPASLTDEEAAAEATVTINRDGSIYSSKITRRSGNPTLDLSVERVLSRVKFRPFPDGSTDMRRTYVIPFNLKSKRSTG